MHTYVCIWYLLYILYIYLFHIYIYIFCIHVITANDGGNSKTGKYYEYSYSHHRHSSGVAMSSERASYSYRSIDQWRDPTHFLAAVPETGHFPHCIHARCDCVGCFNCLIVVATHLHTMSHGRLALHDSIHLWSQSYPEYGA